jgi:hypothetical protein
MTINKATYRETKEKLFGLRQRPPNMTDFINDDTKKPTDNRTANNIIQMDKQINILNSLVKELKDQLKQRDELLKNIEKSLVEQATTNNNPAIVDNLLINIADTLQQKRNEDTTENI